MDELSRRGHELIVITSKKERGSNGSQEAENYLVLRRLVGRVRPGNMIDQLTRWRPSHIFGMMLTFVREIFFDLQDLSFIDRQIKQFQPDVIYLGHITIFSKALMPYLADCRFQIVYDEGGSGLIDSWTERGIWYKFAENYASRFSLLNNLKSLVIKFICLVSANRIKPHWGWPANMQIIFNSELNHKNAITCGVPVFGSHVIHSGIDTKKFAFTPKTKFGSPLSLIVPGRIEPRKGQLDAVRLLAKLREQGVDAKLVLVGGTLDQAYNLELEHEITGLHLENNVERFPMIAHEKLIDLYHQADICFFPSYFRTGFSRVPLEAMACGCITFSYGNEGSDEVLCDDRTGYIATSTDLIAVASVVVELISRPVRVKEITETARKEIEMNYSMEKYADRIEQLIINTARIH